MISVASKEGLSHLPCCLCLQQKRKSLCGCFCWSWPSESSRDAQQDAAGSMGLTQPRGCARGGRRKKRQCRTCPVQPPIQLAHLSLPIPAVSCPEGVFWAHDNFCQCCRGWKRSSRHTEPSTLPRHKPLTAQPAHLHIVESDLGSHMYSLTECVGSREK